MRTVRFADGPEVAALGQGTWKMGEGGRPAADEAAALRLGLDLGMALVDTAEMYGDGAAEQVVARAVAGRREQAFLVSKVTPHNASRTGVPRACAASLARLGAATLDLYLLHWRGGVPLAETVAAFAALRAAGHIRRWGVSNFDVADMQALWRVPGGPDCAANQVLYNPEHRGIEHDLLPWCRDHGVVAMAYSPVGQGGRLLRHPALASVAGRHGATPAQVAVAWSLRLPGVISIPKAGDASHVRANRAAADLVLSADDLAEIDAAFPPPRRKAPLAML